MLGSLTAVPQIPDNARPWKEGAEPHPPPPFTPTRKIAVVKFISHMK